MDARQALGVRHLDVQPAGAVVYECRFALAVDRFGPTVDGARVALMIALVGGAGWWTVPVAFSSGNGSFDVTNYAVD